MIKCLYPRKRTEALQKRQAVKYHFRKEVIEMPITLTFHVFGITITVTVKSTHRHSGK